MEIIVEGPESFANESYSLLLERTLVDMGITTSIDKVKMIIRPAEPLFIISIRMRKAGGSRMVSEISTIEEREGGTFISIIDENYAPRLLSLLWRTFGRERIEQITRLEIFAKGMTAGDIESLRLDPEEELKKKLLDAVWRLLPEGFKVRQEEASEIAMTITATERTLTPEQIALGASTQKEMEAL
ncbi:MAG TPA: methanogenesis marker 17 protein [Methanomassiliicoccales archaeon]|jgi:putative methanogenesis marker protein 17